MNAILIRNRADRVGFRLTSHDLLPIGDCQLPIGQIPKLQISSRRWPNSQVANFQLPMANLTSCKFPVADGQSHKLQISSCRWPNSQVEYF
jgi:hypothetical protein